IGVDPPIAGAGLAPRRDHGRAVGQVDGELLGKCGPYRRTFELGDEVGKGGTDIEIGDWEAAGLGNHRVVPSQHRTARLCDEAGHYKEWEGVGYKRGAAECLEIEEPRAFADAYRCCRHRWLLISPPGSVNL